MRYTVNLLDASIDPVEWAQRREQQGWHGLSVADHLFTGHRPYPHVWVTATAMAMATSTVPISTAFVNNLFRSPIEVAQAALQLQRVSDGRFELGLGAGWADEEVTGAGLRYPDPAERAGRLAEAAQIIREVFDRGACAFEGRYYDISIPHLGPRPDQRPPLVASVGGPRTVREVTPHLDRVEIKAQSAATRAGRLDLEAMAATPVEHLHAMVRRVREVRPDIEISLFTLFSVGDDPSTRRLAELMDRGGGLFGRFFGEPERVASGLAWLESIGIDRASLSPMTEQALDLLAPHVL